MNTRAEIYVKNKAREVVRDILDQQQQESVNMNKQYKTLVNPARFRVDLFGKNEYTGRLVKKLNLLSVSKFLKAEHQKERYEANQKIPKLNKEWGNLCNKRVKLIAEIDKRTKLIDSTTPKLVDNPELVDRVVKATDERQLLELELTNLSGTISGYENRMNTLADIVNDDLVRHSHVIVEQINELRAKLDIEEAEAQGRLDYSNRVLKGKFELPAELDRIAKRFKVSESDDDPTYINDVLQ